MTHFSQSAWKILIGMGILIIVAMSFIPTLQHPRYPYASATELKAMARCMLLESAPGVVEDDEGPYISSFESFFKYVKHRSPRAVENADVSSPNPFPGLFGRSFEFGRLTGRSRSHRTPLIWRSGDFTIYCDGAVQSGSRIRIPDTPEGWRCPVAAPTAPATRQFPEPPLPELTIHKAAELGDIVQIRANLYWGRRVNARDEKNNTPLRYAVERGNINAARMLLDAGASARERYDDRLTPLDFAAAGGYVSEAELLISRGADVNSLSDYGKTPLDWAVGANQTEMVKLLASRGAIRGRTE